MATVVALTETGAAKAGALDWAVIEAQFAQVLSAKPGVEATALQRARLLAERDGDRLWRIGPRLGLISEDEATALLASIAGIPLLAPGEVPSAAILSNEISARFLETHGLVPLAATDRQITVATADPEQAFALDALEKASGRCVVLRLAPPQVIERALARLYTKAAPAEAEPAELDELLVAEQLDEADRQSQAPAIRFLNGLIEHAVEVGASDIHLEPHEFGLGVRLRQDGALRQIEGPSADLSSAVLSRVKLLAHMNIAERRLPQDGRIRITVRGKPIDLRIATIPSLRGEGIVLRILDRSSIRLDLDALGFDQDAIGLLDRLIHAPNGIFLATGPTGSGKTTTLYAAIARLDRARQKIITIEDPVEHHLPGLIQTSIHTAIGLDFARLLRASLRQDPDVILVGEIRDLETARIAVQAALTGHFVFSTLHTNSAIATLARLTDMGVPAYLLTAALRGILAQRLVRRLCPSCKRPASVRIGEAITLPAYLRAFAHQAHFEPVGCDQCQGQGYRGRTVVYEILPFTRELASLVPLGKSDSELEKAARGAGMRPLMECALAKAAAGETSLEETLRIAIDS